MEEKTQILFIHGGMTFKSKKDYLNFLKTREISIEDYDSWSSNYFNKKLSSNFQIIKPRFPLKDNAKYLEWKIHFERHFPFIEDNIILVGFSLGGIFLAKYLSENKFPKKILSTYLVAPPYDNTLSEEDLAGGFKLKSDLSLLDESSKNLHLLFSEDDKIVPLVHAKKYEKKLKTAKIHTLKNKNGHFRVSEFPELINMIKTDKKEL